MRLRFIYACCIIFLLTGCYKQEKVQIAQTFCIENLSEDAWLMEETTIWNGGSHADSAKMLVSSMQFDSVRHFFTLSEGGPVTPAYVPTTSILDLYLTQGCVINTRLVNQSDGKIYEWMQELFPVESTEEIEGVPFMWKFVASQGTVYNASHVFKCVINPGALND